MATHDRALAYEIVDVFTDRAYAGNPLAVVLDADELDTAALQAIAKEFNLSETAFPMRPATPGASYRVRIFTPAAELPFAGHPSVGTAWVLSRLGRIGTGAVVQECGAGLLPVQVAEDGSAVTLTGGAPSLGDPVDPQPLLAAVGLAASDLAGPASRRAGTGIEFGYLCVRDDAVARARPDLALLAEGPAPGDTPLAGIFVFAWDAAAAHAHARVFAGDVGVVEDPATGSAALGLGVWLVATGLLPADGDASYTVVQGVEMGRPSQLRCTVSARDGRAVAATVSGAVVPVARGEIIGP